MEFLWGDLQYRGKDDFKQTKENATLVISLMAGSAGAVAWNR